MVEAQAPSTQLLAKNTVLLAKIIDHQQLALVHPPGERDQQETERIQNSGHVAKPIIASRAGCRARNFRDGNGSGFRTIRDETGGGPVKSVNGGLRAGLSPATGKAEQR